MAAAATPLPREDKTPPVMKINLVFMPDYVSCLAVKAIGNGCLQGAALMLPLQKSGNKV
jgi:hypothetical protein